MTDAFAFLTKTHLRESKKGNELFLKNYFFTNIFF